MKRGTILVAASLLTAAMMAQAAPELDLFKTGSVSQTNDILNVGTASYSLDLFVNTDNNPVSGLQYYFTTSPTNTTTFGATPITPLNTPFTATDEIIVPSTGGALTNQAQSTTAWFKSSAGDYSPFTNDIATYQLDISSLGAGTYVFTPVGVELSNSTTNSPINSFALPGSFVLTLVPEPATCALTGLGLLALAAWRRRAS